MESKQQTLGEQLARLPLHDPQHKGNGAVEPLGRWGSLIVAITSYHNKYNGQSPSNPYLAQSLGLSPGQVQHTLAEMEKHGLLLDKNGWPRRLIIKCSARHASNVELGLEDKPEEEKKVEQQADFAQPPPARQKAKRREPMMTMAKKFAQALTDFYDTHGRAPMVKEIGPMIGYSEIKPVGASRVAKYMVERGWLFHESGHQADFVLTGLGRAVLFNEPLRNEVHTDMLVRPQARPAVLERAFPKEVEVRHRQEPEPEKDCAQQPFRPVVERRQADQQTRPNFDSVDTVDLVLELQARGFRVTR